VWVGGFTACLVVPKCAESVFVLGRIFYTFVGSSQARECCSFLLLLHLFLLLLLLVVVVVGSACCWLLNTWTHTHISIDIHIMLVIFALSL